MMEVNLTVVGNVVADPEPGVTRNGVPYASFRVASTSRRLDKETGDWVPGDTLYLHVQCWRGLARSVVKTLHKGSPVLVQGRLHTRTVSGGDQPGEQRRTYTELTASAVGLDLARMGAVAAVERGERQGQEGQEEEQHQSAA